MSMMAQWFIPTFSARLCPRAATSLRSCLAYDEDKLIAFIFSSSVDVIASIYLSDICWTLFSIRFKSSFPMSSLRPFTASMAFRLTIRVAIFADSASRNATYQYEIQQRIGAARVVLATQAVRRLGFGS